MRYKMVVLGLCGGSAVETIKGKNVKSDDMLTLSFFDFAHIDAKDTNGVRRTGDCPMNCPPNILRRVLGNWIFLPTDFGRLFKKSEE